MSKKDFRTFPINCAGRLYKNINPSHNFGEKYSYLIPAEYVDHNCMLGDCWIVDVNRNPHLGYCNSPIPYDAEFIGEEVPYEDIY